ncbi:MAG TPA: glycerophosphodiester phosphodiesterase family protein [Ilumatobacter sp.]|nr:glycerophosphodiester phosphodiesterase family protein [Ilumatobacter sp.]
MTREPGRRVRSAVAWCAGWALLAAACGGDDPDSSATATTGTGTTGTGTTDTGTTDTGTTDTGTTDTGTIETGAIMTTEPATGESVASTTMESTQAPAVTAAATTTSPTTLAPSPTPTPELQPPTITELIESGKVLNIAHAGGDQDSPHSTMYAFAQAVLAGADMLEMDIRVTADGEIVVHHDADTTKTANATLVVADTDLTALQALDNAYWFSPECWPCRDLPDESYVFRGVRTGDAPPPDGFTPDHFRIITLAELDEAFPAMPFDIEIKPEGAAGIAAAQVLADELDRLDRLDSTIVVSFDSSVVAAFHEAAPDVATSPGVDEMAAWLLAGTPLPDHHDVVQVPPMFDDIVVLSPEMLQLAAESGVAVWVWPNDASTQENQAFYESLVAMGVTGILAGRPAQASAAIAAG